MTRRTLIASATLTLATLLGWPIPSAAAADTASETKTFTAVADAFVSAATPRRNYGKSRRMYADAKPITRSFMRFNVQNLSGPIVSASLWVYVVRGSGQRYLIRKVASNHWRERTITNANRPRHAGPGRGSGRLRSGWTAVDVSSLVTDKGLLSLRLTTRSSSTVTIQSREARKKGPRLIVKTEKDLQGPTVPMNLVISDQTATSVSLSWDESTDDVGIGGYRIYVNSSEVGTATGSGYTVSGLNCGTTYALEVEAYDLANNMSERATLNTSTEACPSEPSAPSSCTYYVNANSGDDSNVGTSEAAPWRSLAKVTNTALAPGDTVCFARDSVWTAQHLFINESGTSDKKITLGVYGTGTYPPVFDGTGAPNGYGTFLRGNHLVWDGITARDYAVMPIEVRGDFVRVEDSLFTLNARAVTTLEGADNFRFTSNTCADNDLMIVNTIGGDDDYGAECVTLVGSNAEIDHNVCYGSDASSNDYVRDGSCINLYGASNARVHDNLAYNNHNFAELGKPGADTSCTDNRFWNNVIRGSSTYSQSVQLVIHIGGTFGPCTYTVFEHNSLALSNASRGIGLYNGVASGPTALTIRNNAVRSFSGSAIAVLGSGGSVADSHNHFFGGSVAWALGTYSAMADPLFASATDLHLQSGSPSIDSGVSLGYATDVEGNPMPRDGNCNGTVDADRGAYEYQNAGC